MSNKNHIKSYDSFSISESVIGKFTTITEQDMKLVKDAKMEDVSSDGPAKDAMIKALESAINYFEMNPSNEIDMKAKLVSKTSTDDGMQELLDLAKTYVASLEKIQRVENDEISPVSEQINNLIK